MHRNLLVIVASCALLLNDLPASCFDYQPDEKADETYDVYPGTFLDHSHHPWHHSKHRPQQQCRCAKDNMMGKLKSCDCAIDIFRGLIKACSSKKSLDHCADALKDLLGDCGHPAQCLDKSKTRSEFAVSMTRIGYVIAQGLFEKESVPQANCKTAPLAEQSSKTATVDRPSRCALPNRKNERQDDGTSRQRISVVFDEKSGAAFVRVPRPRNFRFHTFGQCKLRIATKFIAVPDNVGNYGHRFEKPIVTRFELESEHYHWCPNDDQSDDFCIAVPADLSGDSAYIVEVNAYPGNEKEISEQFDLVCYIEDLEVANNVGVQVSKSKNDLENLAMDASLRIEKDTEANKTYLRWYHVFDSQYLATSHYWLTLVRWPGNDGMPRANGKNSSVPWLSARPDDNGEMTQKSTLIYEFTCKNQSERMEICAGLGMILPHVPYTAYISYRKADNEVLPPTLKKNFVLDSNMTEMPAGSEFG